MLSRIMLAAFLTGLLCVLLILPIKMGEQANRSIPIIGKMEVISEEHCKQVLKNATIAYGFAKLINKSVSTIQRTEIAVTPFGIGVSFAPGELLSAANEAIERVSAALFSVIGLMLVEKMTIGLISFFCFKFLLPSSLVLALLHCVAGKVFVWAKPMASFIAQLAIVSWLFFPTVAIVTGYVEKSYLDAVLHEKLESVDKAQDAVTRLEDGMAKSLPQEKPLNDIEEDSSLWPSFTGIYQAIKKTFSYVSVERIKGKVSEILNYADDISDNLFHVFCIFLLTTVVIPLFMLLIFLKFVQSLTSGYMNKNKC